MIEVTIKAKRDSGFKLHSRSFTKVFSNDDNSVQYTFRIDDNNKEETVRMLSDSLGLDFHPKKECMVILHDEIVDSPDDVKDSYNRLMSKLEQYGY